MARLPRLTVPGYPHHVLQRGSHRLPTFHDEADYRTMLALLEEHAKREGVAVHAYVLMPNHLHLLATPDTVTALPALMQAVGRRYVQAFNRRHARTGTLWEGRYRATVLDPRTYLLPCMVYLDLNPVRTGLVARAADYPWSSHGHYVGLRQDPLITVPAGIWALGNTPFAREAAYADQVQQGLGNRVEPLTEALLKGWALGTDDFVERLQKLTQRRVTRAKAGRPRRAAPGTLPAQ